MRASEFIKESRFGSIQPDVARALPATYAITSLPNQDPYLQYRFGVAIASAKGREQREKDGVTPYKRSTPWGQDEIVVSFDPNIETWLDDALGEMGMKASDAKLLSTIESQEDLDVDKTSPVRKYKGVLGK